MSPEALFGLYERVTVKGFVKVEMLVVAPVSAARLKTSVPTVVSPLGVPAVAKNATGSSFLAWKVALVDVALKDEGTVKAMLPRASEPFPEIVWEVEVETEADPVQPEVRKLPSDEVAVFPAKSEDCTWK